MNPPAIVTVTTDHLFILQGHAVPMQEFEKWAKGMQQIIAGGHGQMTVQNALETYMSYACLMLSDLQLGVKYTGTLTPIYIDITLTYIYDSIMLLAAYLHLFDQLCMRAPWRRGSS